MAIAIAVPSACREQSGSTLARVRDEGFLRAGYAQEPPYAFLDVHGQVAGESPLALLGALHNVAVDSVRWVRMDFRELIPSLLAGRVDVIASGLFPVPARVRDVRFTRPTTCARPALVVREGGPAPQGLRAFAEEDGPRLAVLGGSVEAEAAAELGVRAHRLVTVPDLSTALAVVRESRADALALTEHTARRSFEHDPTGLRWYAYEPDPAIAHLVRGCSALAVRPSDDRLLAALDSGLAAYVGSARQRSDLERLGIDRVEIP